MTQFSQALKSEGKKGQSSEFSATHRSLPKLQKIICLPQQPDKIHY